MDTFELLELANATTKILDHLKIQTEMFEEKYSQTVQHFEIGETVYYINNHGFIVPAVIEAIHGPFGDGGCIFYDIRPEGAKITKLDKIKFWIYLHHNWFNLKHEVPKGYPGHSVSAGDDIFKTEEDANYMMTIYNSMYHLSDYLSILEEQLNESE